MNEELAMALCRGAAAAGLAAGAVADIRTGSVPLWLPALMGAAGLVLRLAAGRTGDLLWSLLPGAILFLTGLASRGQVGTGDGLMLLALGACVSPAAALLALFFGLAAEALLGVILRVARGRSLRCGMPFLPFLCGGALCAFFLIR
ncbi:MAG: prepilin peptidase [Lachnospiraceae bacterium]|nr:prepilin peptidase [Lachnospiraceae bacterium]